MGATTANDPLDLHYAYNQLSLTDLLHARDTYHFHLMNKQNVVGTAVGYYLIRKSDPAPDATGRVRCAPGPRVPRTFGNSEVRDYSWPCVLVLVSTWEDEDQFGGGRAYDPTQMVPKTLFLPDGQAVPVCVVLAAETDHPEASTPAAIARCRRRGSSVAAHRSPWCLKELSGWQRRGAWSATAITPMC